MLRHAISTVLAILPASATLSPAAEPSPTPTLWTADGPMRPWSVTGKLAKGKDTSAAALLRPDFGVVASDETRFFQTFGLDPATRAVRMGPQIVLLPGEGTELDLEAVATAEDGRHLYLLGSHGKARKKDVIEATRSLIFRVPLDRETGRPAATGHDRSSLRDWLAAVPETAAALDAPTDGTGVDLEGLAERGGSLFIGARAPLADGKAVVLEIPAAEVFGSPATGRTQPKIHKLALGPGLGIRSLERIADGFLLIAGAAVPDPDEGAEFLLGHWPGPGSAVAEITRMRDLPGKAEGMMVVNAGPDSIELLLWFDGAKDGGPQSLKLRRGDRT